MKIVEIEPKTLLYRYVSLPPQDVKIGEIYKNSKQKGRFDKYQDIYYCCNSLSAIIIEHNSNLNGSLIVSEVIKPLTLIKMPDELLFKSLSDNYDITNIIGQMLLECTDSDGILYPSKRGFPNGYKNYCISDVNKEVVNLFNDCDFNIALGMPLSTLR